MNKATAMIPSGPTMTIPIRTDESGAIRVGDTRVLLELVIRQYLLGETPEGIADSYPSLAIGDIYAVIGYYLTHRDEVDAYVRKRDHAADLIIQTIERELSPSARALRTRLSALRDQKRAAP